MSVGMADRDTEIRRGPAGFPSTRNTWLCGLLDPSSSVYRASLDELCAQYWRPVYAYLRVGRSKTNEDAKDLTQEFFSWISSGERFRSYDPSRGTFRSYLKGALRHFVSDHAKRRSERALASAPVGVETPDPSPLPEMVFDRAWARTLLNESMNELRGELGRRNRDQTCRIFEAYEDAREGTQACTYEDLGMVFDLTPTQVRAHLQYARLLLRSLLVQRISSTVADEESLFQELTELFETRP